MKGLNTPNFSWGFFNFGLRRSDRSPPLLLFSPRVVREERYQKTKRDLLLRRRLTLEIPQLKLGVLRQTALRPPVEAILEWASLYRGCRVRFPAASSRDSSYAVCEIACSLPNAA